VSKLVSLTDKHFGDLTAPGCRRPKSQLDAMIFFKYHLACSGEKLFDVVLPGMRSKNPKTVRKSVAGMLIMMNIMTFTGRSEQFSSPSDPKNQTPSCMCSTP